MPRQYTYRIFQDALGRPVRLSMARWRHIQRKHPEVSEEKIRQTLAEPESILERASSRLYCLAGNGAW
jgi:hypothetical protein